MRTEAFSFETPGKIDFLLHRRRYPPPFSGPRVPRGGGSQDLARIRFLGPAEPIGNGFMLPWYPSPRTQPPGSQYARGRRPPEPLHPGRHSKAVPLAFVPNAPVPLTFQRFNGYHGGGGTGGNGHVPPRTTKAVCFWTIGVSGNTLECNEITSILTFQLRIDIMKNGIMCQMVCLGRGCRRG